VVGPNSISPLSVRLRGAVGGRQNIRNMALPQRWTFGSRSFPSGVRASVADGGTLLQLKLDRSQSRLRIDTAAPPASHEILQIIHFTQASEPVMLRLDGLSNVRLSPGLIKSATATQTTDSPDILTKFMVEFPSSWAVTPSRDGYTISSRTPPETSDKVQITWSLSGPGIAKPSPSAPVPELLVAGPAGDQEFVKTAVHRLQSQLPGSGLPAGPFGLFSKRYAGHIFWDADVWILPSALFLDPDAAQAIAEFRLASVPAAIDEYQNWIAEGRPTARSPLRNEHVARPGLKFPWESRADGREGAEGESRFQDHVTASAIRGLEWASSFSLILPERSHAAGQLAAGFYQSRIQSGTNGRSHIPSTLSPSERHIGDDDLYTNVMAEAILRRYATPNADLHRPRDHETFLTFEGDTLGQYQQAAALLACFPGQDSIVEAEASKLYDRFHDKVTEFGPAMSHAIHATVAARLGRSEEAYEDWRASWIPYMDSAGYFREKLPAGERGFLTGEAAAVNAVLYGFLGLRIDTREPKSGWKMRLANGHWLGCQPKLPRAWRSITLRNVQILGSFYTFHATHDRLQVEEFPGRPEELPAKRR